MSEDLKPVPWIIFDKVHRGSSVVVQSVDYPSALLEGAKRLRVRPDAVDYSPIYLGENAAAAKARVAGSVG